MKTHPLLLQMNKRESCDGLLTEQECLASLKCFKMNKSPGCDGIPSEFYLEISA